MKIRCCSFRFAIISYPPAHNIINIYKEMECISSSSMFAVIRAEWCCERPVQPVHASGSVFHEAVGGRALASHAASLLQASQDSSHPTNPNLNQQ